MNEHRQFKKDAATRTVVQSIVTDLQNLSKIVRSSSKQASETHADLLDRLLLIEGMQIPLLKELLTHLMRIIEFKGVVITGLAVVSKVISLLKMTEDKTQEKSQSNREFFQQILNILVIASKKQKDGQIALRVIQNTFSLIQPDLLQRLDYHLMTRLYSICFGCCIWPQIQSISVSALFSLTDILFRQQFNKEISTIFIDFLNFLLHNKKTLWLKDLELKGIIWDLVLIAVRNINNVVWGEINNDKILVELLNQMYMISMENSFSKGSNLIQQDMFRNTIRLQHEKAHSNHQRKDLMVDYIKYYKVFIYFSIHLSLNLKEEDEIVPFRKHINIFHNLYDYPRSIRFYILLEGIVLILSHGYSLILIQQGGIMLVDVFQKVCQDLYSSKLPFQIVWENSQLLIEQIFGDYSKLSDQDYLKVTKNMLVRLRKTFEDNKKYVLQMTQKDGDMSISSNTDSKDKPKESQLSYRWRRLIKSIIRIIRYLTTLNFKQNSNDQAIRRFLMQLQNWFILCPTYKTRNTILLELQHITNNIENQNQAIKASQCMQICSNILYGFYELLNSVGICTMIRIMANIKVNYLLGKDFNQLEEVCLMADKFYIEQRLIGTQEEFTVTIQGFVQCMNLLVADMQLPSEKEGTKIDISEKYMKMIDYVLLKLKFVLELNVEFSKKDWSFIVCFWVSMCSCKQTYLQTKMLAHIESVFTVFVKNSMIGEKQILKSYTELSKLNILEVSKQILMQLKSLILLFKNEEVIVSIINILKELNDQKYFEALKQHIFELQEIIIQESLFKIRSQENLLIIIDFLNFKGKSKNEQYGTVSFLWKMADHLKTLHKDKQQSEKKVWKRLFNKIIQFAKQTDHPGTRQSCIHTFTQIIADYREALGEELFVEFLTKQYLEIFCLLMGFDESVPRLQSLLQVEMQKMAVKNLIKLVKKCLNEGNEEVTQLLEFSLKNLKDFIEKSGKNQPVEYYLELCQLFLFFKQLEEERQQKNHLKSVTNLWMLIKEILLEIQKLHQCLDQSTYLWKKKYLPFYEQLKLFFGNDQ